MYTDKDSNLLIDRTIRTFVQNYMIQNRMRNLLQIINFDETLDLSTIHLGRIDTTRVNKIKVEERFFISEQGYTVGKLLDGTEHQILLDTELANHLCLNHIIYIVNPCNHYQNLHLKHK